MSIMTDEIGNSGGMKYVKSAPTFSMQPPRPRATILRPGRLRPTLVAPRSTGIRKSTDADRESFSLHQESRNDLENCVVQIESILDDPGVASNLTSQQRAAIKTLRLQINRCEEASQLVVPHGILDDLDDPSHRYIATLYGGVKLPSQNDFTSANSTIAEVLQQQKPYAAYASFEGSSLYVPSEWVELGEERQTKLAEILSLDNLKRWNFDIRDVVKYADIGDGTPPNVLLLVGWSIIASPDAQKVMAVSLNKEFHDTQSGYEFSEHMKLNHTTLVSFLRAVESHYESSNPYHNNIHAADVLQTFHALISMGSGGISDVFNKMDVYSMLLAAVCHDVAHPGTNNLYQMNARTDLAITYNDNSVLENMHAAKTFQILFGEDENLFRGLSTEDLAEVRSIMINAILATDMSHHFSKVSHINDITSQLGDDVDWTQIDRSGDDDFIKEVLQFMLHLADISNPTKPRDIAVYWAECALTEFFSQGDLEVEQDLPVSPLCNRNETNLATSQHDFIKYVVLPAFEVLGMVIPEVDNTVLPEIGRNLEFWESLS